jgi:hypothetical protein
MHPVSVILAGHFVEDIQSVLGSLRTYNFVHIKRETNLATHGLAGETTTHVVDFTWLEEILDVIYNIVCRESRNIANLQLQ